LENTFGRNIIPDNEAERLENLKKYNILYSKAEPAFDELAILAATTFNVPLAMVNFVDKESVWTKTKHGAEADEDVERGTSICSLAILNDCVTVFENTLAEPQLMSNPLVAGEFGLRFYAAAPITTSDGFNIGVICILDQEPRKFSDSDQKQLELLATRVREEIEKRLG
jgi:GAF domain-containing protein